MRRAPNQSIGTVPCWHRNCEADALVYRFTDRGGVRRRFAGKLYARCQVHGAYGLDGCEASQEYILENADIAGAKPKSAAQVDAFPEPEPEPTPAPVVNVPAAPAAEPAKRSTWGFF